MRRCAEPCAGRRPDIVRPWHRAGPLIASVPFLGILLWWGLEGGGYDEAVWLPGTLGLLGLVAAVQFARGPRRPPGWALPAAIAALAAFTIWSYLSILWADTPGVALAGSHRTVSYFLAFTVMALVPWDRRSLLWVLAAWVAVVTGLAVVTLTRLLGDDWGSLLIDARLAAPLGYQNADPALWSMGALPALLLAADRRVPLVVRPPLLAAAGLLFALPLASQSRGWLFTLPVMLLATLLLAPRRIRLLLHAIPVAVAVAVVAPRMLRPFELGGSQDLVGLGEPFLTALHRAAGGAALAALIALVGGLLLALADRWVRPGRTWKRRVRTGGWIATGLTVAAAVGAGMVATDGRPLERVDRAWESFKDYEQPTDKGQDRFSRLGSSRYDFWRVSLDIWGERPLAGVGQDNFAERYLVARQSTEEPRWTHSLPLRLLVHTGAVGLLLFLAWAALAALAAGGGVRRTPEARLAVAAAMTPGVVWLAHGSVDWLWEYPLLSAAALGFAGAAASLGARERAQANGERRAVWVHRGPARLVVAVATMLAWLGLATALAAAFLAERNTDLATRHWRLDPPLALDRLERAASLNALDARAPLTHGLILHALGRDRDAVPRLREAISRAPRDWLAPFELALIEGGAGARRLLLEARARNPGEPLIGIALRRERRGRPLTAEEAALAFRERIARRVGPAARFVP